MQFPVPTLKSEFIRIRAQTSFHQERPQSQKPTTVQRRTQPPAYAQTQSEMSETITDTKEDGTSKFLTMKVANRLLGLMMVEQSKGKRVPIVWAQDKKKELEGLLNKPFGGKMHFDPRTFDWLIDNTISKSQALLRKRNELRIEKVGGQVLISDSPYDNNNIETQVEEGMVAIQRTLRFRPQSAANLHDRKNLKNRRTVVNEFQISARIKENATSQAYRNKVVHELEQRGDSALFQNESYVSHFI